MNYWKSNQVRTCLKHLRQKSIELWTRSEIKQEKLLKIPFHLTIKLDWWLLQDQRVTWTTSTKLWLVLDNKTLKVNVLLLDSIEELFLISKKMTMDLKVEVSLKIHISKVWLHQNFISMQWVVEKESSILQLKHLKQVTFKEDWSKL